MSNKKIIKEIEKRFKECHFLCTPEELAIDAYKICEKHMQPQWQPIETYKGGCGLFYYPAIECSVHKSNNKPETIVTDKWYSRKATHWVPLPAAPKEGE